MKYDKETKKEAKDLLESLKKDEKVSKDLINIVRSLHKYAKKDKPVTLDWSAMETIYSSKLYEVSPEISPKELAENAIGKRFEDFPQTIGRSNDTNNPLKYQHEPSKCETYIPYIVSTLQTIVGASSYAQVGSRYDRNVDEIIFPPCFPYLEKFRSEYHEYLHGLIDRNWGYIPKSQNKLLEGNLLPYLCEFKILIHSPENENIAKKIKRRYPHLPIYPRSGVEILDYLALNHLILTKSLQHFTNKYKLNLKDASSLCGFLNTFCFVGSIKENDFLLIKNVSEKLGITLKWNEIYNLQKEFYGEKIVGLAPELIIFALENITLGKWSEKYPGLKLKLLINNMRLQATFPNLWNVIKTLIEDKNLLYKLINLPPSKWGDVVKINY